MLIINVTTQMPLELNEAIIKVFNAELQELNQKIAASAERLNMMKMNLNNSNHKS